MAAAIVPVAAAMVPVAASVAAAAAAQVSKYGKKYIPQILNKIVKYSPEIVAAAALTSKQQSNYPQNTQQYAYPPSQYTQQPQYPQNTQQYAYPPSQYTQQPQYPQNTQQYAYPPSQYTQQPQYQTPYYPQYNQQPQYTQPPNKGGRKKTSTKNKKIKKRLKKKNWA